MTAAELMKVKQYQREYKKLFDKHLEVDFISMKGVTVTDIDDVDVSLIDRKEVNLEMLLEKCLTKHDADINKIREREKRLQMANFKKERAAVKEYCKIVVHLRGNVNEAAKLINRDRSVIYHYAGMR